jgi:monofunctional biosynthetic peptidoglycan transglycosylase
MRKKIFWIAILIALIPPTWYLVNLPDVSQLRMVNPKTTAIRMFRETQIRKKGGKPHSLMTWRTLNQISPDLLHAVVLAEDDAFYQHHGFDFEQLKRAARTNWQRKRYAFGASTITQQLARTLYLSSHKNLFRKAKEALITRRLEKTLSKKRILELYLNSVEWGPQVYGAEAAAQYFFHKSALELTSDEAIALTVILPSPRKWNPLKEGGFIGKRKAILYDRMVRANYLTPVVSTDTLVSPIEEFEQPEIEEKDTASEEVFE